MEDYDKFVQFCLSQRRKNEDKKQKRIKPLSASSVVLFCGRPILPPLLSEKQREEMRLHRDEMQKATIHKKFTDARMDYVQTILHSTQLRKILTPKEVLEESEIKNEFLHPQDTNKASHSNVLFAGSMDTITSASGVFFPPKTSTTRLPQRSPKTAFFPSGVSAQQSYHERCLNSQHDSQQEPQPCSFSSAIHLSPSSGYVTYKNPENKVPISEWTKSGPERHGFMSPEEIDERSGFSLQNTANTIAKMSDIISHPPIDGEELERCGLESNFLPVKHIDDSLFYNDSLTCNPQNTEQFKISHLENVEHEEYIPIITQSDPSSLVNLERNEGLITLPNKTFLSDNLNVLQTLNKPQCLISEPQKNLSEVEPVGKQINKSSTKQSEKLHPMSLQALLKKSQEYRRRQWLLRNEAKNAKIQEKNQEQPKAWMEEQSLSDKENEDKDIRVVEDKKTKRQRGSLIPSIKENTTVSETSEERTNIKNESVSQNRNTAELMSVEEETTLKNKFNSFQESITQSKQNSSLIQHRKYQDTFNRIPCFRNSHIGVGKCCAVLVPKFCLSPIRCKNKDGPKDRPIVEENTSIENFDLNQVKEVPSTANLLIGDDSTSAFAKSSLHIDQLESSLSCLKVLISDLESTVKENLDSETESNMQSESGFKSIKQSELIIFDQLAHTDCFDCVKDEQSGDDGGNNADIRELQRKQPFVDYEAMHEDLEAEASFIDVNDVHLTVQERTLNIDKLNQEKICKTAATERDGGKEKCAKVFVGSDPSTKQLFSAKCLTSVAQLMLVSDKFRNISSENTLFCDTSVLSEQSNCPELKEREVTAEAQRPFHSPSLNQSYDVEMPSGLWLLEGLESDLGSQSHSCHAKYLTPESGGEEQGEVSKVKRKLLMHVTHETQEKSANLSGATSSMVRPNSSTPRAAVCEGIQKGVQEQLKQTHAAQVQALQDKHMKQQEEPLQPLRLPLQFFHPLLAAAMKGFLTRRLLRTKRVAHLVRTIRDTQQFLQAPQLQDAARGEFYCRQDDLLQKRQDDLLQKRVALQLRSARYEVHDIFFSLSDGERLQLISWDRELIKDRQLRKHNGHSGVQSFLSAATQKSLERRRETMIQKKLQNYTK